MPTILTADNGKRRRIYKRWATPFELLRASQHCPGCLRAGVTMAGLEECARSQTDTEAGVAMQEAKRQLFRSIARKRPA